MENDSLDTLKAELVRAKAAHRRAKRARNHGKATETWWLAATIDGLIKARKAGVA